jgi:predicted RNase H-like nuclease
MFIGIDSAPGGWVAAFLQKSRFTSVVFYQTLLSIPHLRQAKAIFIDMPIGLPAFHQYPRRCDREAKAFLGKRHSSIFYAPPRNLIGYRDYHAANALMKQKCQQGMSRQSFNIIPKIIELDHFIRGGKNRQLPIYEAHPEVCLTQLWSAQQSGIQSKHTSMGISQRKTLIMNYAQNAVEFWPAAEPKETQKIDDMLDAMLLAIAAATASYNCFGGVPNDFDEENLPMRICYPEISLPAQVKRRYE